MSATRILCLLALAAALCVPPAQGATEKERLIKVVALSRHGVRAPTQSEKTLALWSAKTWPAWPVGRGELTARGYELVRAQWANLRGMFVEKGLIGEGQCMPADDIFVRSDVDERDQATSQAILAGLGAKCRYGYAVLNEDIDPLFHPVKAGLYRFDPVAVATDVQMMTNGGFDHLREILGGPMNLLNRISGPPAPQLCERYNLSPGCAFEELPNAVSVSADGSDIRLTGGLGIASSLAEIFLLEYAQWPGVASGWGQVNSTVLGQILPIHARIFSVVNRAPIVAWARGSGLLREIAAALNGKHHDGRANKAKITVFVGHDTNIANVGGLLGVRWKSRGYPFNGIPPGSALFFELWEKDGKKEVRISFYAQKPETLHAAFAPKAGGKAVAPEEFAAVEAKAWAPPVVGQAIYDPQEFENIAIKATEGAPVAKEANPPLVWREFAQGQK